MHTPRQDLSRRGKPGTRIRLAGALLATAAALIAIPTAPALASGGGTSITGSDGGGSSRSCGNARLKHGKAIAPDCAPARVKMVINAANDIRKKPYVYGGGHGSFKDNGYDCSGSVSYALHGGRLLKHPLDSSGFMHWQKHGKGSWITVYANPGHAFMTVAGLRFDTSMVRGDGPGWSKKVRAEDFSQFKKRHKGHF